MGVKVQGHTPGVFWCLCPLSFCGGFIASSLNFLLLLFLVMVVYKEAGSTGSISWSQQGQSCTSMRTLSSSICGLNRKISRKALKVITLDKKGICSGSRAADSSTFSYFVGSSVTGVQFLSWGTVRLNHGLDANFCLVLGLGAFCWPALHWGPEIHGLLLPAALKWLWCCFNNKAVSLTQVNMLIICLTAAEEASRQLDWGFLFPALMIKTLCFCFCDQCKCWPGFYLKDDGRTCVDVDECSTTLPCSQRCINTYGSYKCLCVDGYEALERNPNTCKALSGKSDFFKFLRFAQRAEAL